MSGDRKVVETVYGKHHKYEIAEKKEGLFNDKKYYIYKDGEFLRSYHSLRDAVQAAESEG